MSAEVGANPGESAALEASRRLERSRRALLDQAVAEKRRHFAAQLALSLAEVLCDDTQCEDAKARA